MTPLASSVAATAVSGSHGNHLPLPPRPPPPSPAPPLPPEGIPLPLFLIRLPVHSTNVSLRSSLLRLLFQLSYHLARSHPWMSPRLFLQLHPLLFLRPGFEFLRREGLIRTRERRRIEKWPLLPSLSPILFLLSLSLFLFSLVNVGYTRKLRCQCR